MEKQISNPTIGGWVVSPLQRPSGANDTPTAHGSAAAHGCPPFYRPQWPPGRCYKSPSSHVISRSCGSPDLGHRAPMAGTVVGLSVTSAASPGSNNRLIFPLDGRWLSLMAKTPSREGRLPHINRADRRSIYGFDGMNSFTVLGNVETIPAKQTTSVLLFFLSEEK